MLRSNGDEKSPSRGKTQQRSGADWRKIKQRWELEKLQGYDEKQDAQKRFTAKDIVLEHLSTLYSYHVPSLQRPGCVQFIWFHEWLIQPCNYTRIVDNCSRERRPARSVTSLPSSQSLYPPQPFFPHLPPVSIPVRTQPKPAHLEQ